MDKIVITGKEYPVLFGIDGALKPASEAMGIPFEKMDDPAIMSMEKFPTILWYAIKLGCEFEEKDFDLSLEKFRKFIQFHEIKKGIELFLKAVTGPVDPNVKSPE